MKENALNKKTRKPSQLALKRKRLAEDRAGEAAKVATDAMLSARLQHVNAFEHAAGVNISDPHWHGGYPREVGAAVRLVLDAPRFMEFKRQIQQQIGEAKLVASSFESILEQLNAIDAQRTPTP